MTLKRQYDEVMGRIKVTDEMHRRILDNIQNMDIASTAGISKTQFLNMKKYLSAAACFAVLLAGLFAVGHMTAIFQPKEPNVTIGNGIAEVDTLDQLAAAVGFDLEELDTLPFEVKTTVYVSYWNELAEITYIGEGQTATFRKSTGTGDISGDYNVYSAVKEINMDSWTATLKGSGEAYALALWSADGYSYSIRLSNEISDSEWSHLISQIC